jgi:hypothetical protein
LLTIQKKQAKYFAFRREKAPVESGLKTEEKYISFTKEVEVDKFKNKDGKEKKVKRELRFMDSFKFMASSLDKLTKGLGRDDLKNLDLMTTHYTEKQQEMLKQKGVYPYEQWRSQRRVSGHANERRRREIS